MSVVYGTISETSPRAESWKRIFGGLRIPLHSPVAIRASSPAGGYGEFYQCPLDALSSDQRERLIEEMASKFSLTREEVEHDLETLGHVPIFAQDVTVEVLGL